MRYLVKAKVKPGREEALLQAKADGTLGEGSIAQDEIQHNVETARVSANGTVKWVETCFCSTPLEEERPHWEKFFELVQIKDAHARHRCRDENGSEPWACCDCDCTAKLEAHLLRSGMPLLAMLRGRLARRGEPNHARSAAQ